MSIDTFYRLSPEEFEAAYNEWTNLRNGEFENTWEQTRLIAFWATIENLKNKSMSKFLPLPWDGKKEKGKRKKEKDEKVHDPERFEMLKKKYGGTV